jgi:ATP-dependent Lhr-like helicase
MLSRIRSHIVHKPLTRISPLAIPVMLDIGKEPIFGEGRESAMADAADELMKEALSGAERS